jgi:peptidoglycan/xylan/chitin deacetylase (PgdA/CDA1 family)
MHDIPIIMLHSVNAFPDIHPMGRLSILPEEFRAYLQMFRNQGYQLISMDRLLAGSFDKTNPYAVITFDDGFKDTLRIAGPILRQFGAEATVFVNPNYVSKKTDVASDWGFMTWEELKECVESGILDVQAHTLTHEFVFISDKIIDFYLPEHFEKYYWLAWMLFPEAPQAWDSTAYAYRDKIPTGYPIFEYGRRVAHRKFVPCEEFIRMAVEAYLRGNADGLNELNCKKGEWESEEVFRAEQKRQIAGCKIILEQRLHREIHTLCFPGGSYDDMALRIAEDAGYRCYMRSSRLHHGNNKELLAQIKDGNFSGLNRTSFSKIRIPGLSAAVAAYLTARISLGSYQNECFWRTVKKLGSKIRRR